MSSNIKGLSIIVGRGVFYVGKYKSGTWFDDDAREKKGFGFKFDLPIESMIRPVGYFWRPAFWSKDKPRIIDYMNEGNTFCNDFFGEKLFRKIMTLGPYHWNKRSVWNPWYARHSFVFKLPKFVWPYLSISTPWFNVYLGARRLKVDPFTKDITWCGASERRKALKESPFDMYYCLAPSISFRKKRD